MDELNPIAGWLRAPCTGGIVVQSPDGATRIRIRPRMASLSSPRDLVDQVSRELFGASIRVVHTVVTPLVTGEGELGALASARLTVSGRAIGCSVAIAGDDPYLCIDVVGARDREYAGTMIRSLGLGRGATRRRWFQYSPPAGWLGLRREHRGVWLHPAYPRVRGRITVFDARPFLSSPAERLDRFLFMRMPDGFTALEPQRCEDTTSAHGLSGRVRIIVGSLDGHRTLRIASAMADDRFSYLAHLESPEDRAVEHTFRAVIASFRPLPRTPSDVLATAVWTD